MIILDPKNVATAFVTDVAPLPGVARVISVVRKDFLAVFDVEPEVSTTTDYFDWKSRMSTSFSIVVVTAGRDALFDELKEEVPALSEIEGKREVFFFGGAVTKRFGSVLLIAGSDKRGTIYGLFRLSEAIGVHAMTFIGDAAPSKKQTVEVDITPYVSKEPSVKYRGFFINDEWPAFGGYCRDRFGDINAAAYEDIFITLLRMKGNYMWPAMWSGRFWNDGPDLASAILADELGVVMGTSHHEPCIRAGEEYRHVRGKDSIYGDAWSYLTNPEGITRFWEDGLKRAGHLENVITVGMRGEADSMILGEDATLKDNIDLLRGVITCQNRLIKELVNEDLTKVPRMLALYKEVERYFYGDETAEGLIDWPELDGITCMLCEDNQGNMRTLPDAAHRNRKGGWGMYYHFDYHGGPVSFEWLNTTLLPKVLEQMSMAYEHGVSEIWIVNVGDLKFNEMPLNYFMDLAYDFEGVSKQDPMEFWRSFCRRYFKNPDAVAELLNDYSHLMHLRRTEAISPETYHPMRDGLKMLRYVNSYMDRATLLAQDQPESFYSMVYFQTMAAVNVLKMQLLAGLNHYASSFGAVVANELAQALKETISYDRSRNAEWDAFKDGKWVHMADSLHVGFRTWNDEGSVYPDIRYVECYDRDRIYASVKSCDYISHGGDWSGRPLIMNEFLYEGTKEACVYLFNGSTHPVSYSLEYDSTRLSVEEGGEISFLAHNEDGSFEMPAGPKGSVTSMRVLRVKLLDETGDTQLMVKFNGGRIRVIIPKRADRIFTIKPERMTAEGNFACLKGVGREGDGYKAFPSTEIFESFSEAPKLHFTVNAEEAGDYVLRLVTAPSNPVSNRGELAVYLKAGDAEPLIVNTIHEGYMGGENSSPEWCIGVLDQKHVTLTDITLKKGMNAITIGARNAAVVVEGVIIYSKNLNYPKSYLEFQTL